MLLHAGQVNHYWQHGYLPLEGWLDDEEVDRLRQELSTLLVADRPGTVRERDGRTVRALHGCHLWSPRFKRLTELTRIAGPAMQLLDAPVYVYQFKINMKAAFGGDSWRWHQDYIYWRNEDGMPAPKAVNVLICLDEITEFNGPLMLIDGSHRRGVIDVRPAPGGNEQQPEWMQHVSVALKYTLDAPTVTRLVHEGGLVAPKGRRGTVMLFHPNIAHASGPNLSPFDRTTAIVTYNSTANIPDRLSDHRPEFLVSRDARPLVLVDGALA